MDIHRIVAASIVATVLSGPLQAQDRQASFEDTSEAGTYVNGYGTDEFAAEQIDGYCESWRKYAATVADMAISSARKEGYGTESFLPPDQDIGAPFVQGEARYDEMSAPLCAYTVDVRSPLCGGEPIRYLAKPRPEIQFLDDYWPASFHTQGEIAVLSGKDTHYKDAFSLVRPTTPDQAYDALLDLPMLPDREFIAVVVESDAGPRVSLLTVPNIILGPLHMLQFSIDGTAAWTAEFPSRQTCYEIGIDDRNDDGIEDIILRETVVRALVDGHTVPLEREFCGGPDGKFSPKRCRNSAVTLPPHLRIKHSH